MRLTTTTNVSVDGVMQGLGRDDEDRRGGFVRGGWAIALTRTEKMDHINEVYSGTTPFLFPPQTYQIFARSWGAGPQMMAHPIPFPPHPPPPHLVSTRPP